MNEQDRLFRRINERFIRAFATYHLLADGDHVLVGLSGGKDSLLLTELLARRARIHHPEFKVTAVHVRMDDISYETNTHYLQQFCNSLDTPLHLITTSMGTSDTPQGQHVKPKPPCFLCSWNRRKQLFNLAQQLGCNKLALGHHQDDLLHTCLMNLLYQGRFGTMPALLKLRKMPLQIIRPLCMIPEALIRQYAETAHYEQQIKHCPYEKTSNRTTAQQLFEMAEQTNPEVRFSLWNALEREGKMVEQE